jgi:hypothetical protein
LAPCYLKFLLTTSFEKLLIYLILKENNQCPLIHSTVEKLYDKAKVPSLKVRRMRSMAIECFKILNKLSPSCLHDLVVFKDCIYHFRYSNIVDIPRVTQNE